MRTVKILLTLILLFEVFLYGMSPLQAADLAPPLPDKQSIEIVSHIGGPALSIEAKNGYAYVGFANQFAIFDLANPIAPKRISYLPIPTTDLALDEHDAFLVGGSGLWIVQIDNPTQPILIAHLPKRNFLAVTRFDNLLYLVDEAGRLCIVDISSKSQPQLQNIVALPTVINDIVIHGHYAYLATSEFGVTSTASGDRPGSRCCQWACLCCCGCSGSVGGR